MFVIEKDNKLSIDLKNKFNNQLIIINDDVLESIYVQLKFEVVRDTLGTYRNVSMTCRTPKAK